MRPQQAHERLEWLQAGAHGGVHPLFQMGLGSGRLPVGPEQWEGLFQVVGPYDGRVPADDGRQSILLIAAEIPGVLQQQPAAAFEVHLLLHGQPLHLTTAHLIHSPVTML